MTYCEIERSSFMQEVGNGRAESSSYLVTGNEKYRELPSVL